VGVGMKEVIARNWEDFVSVGQKYDLCCFCELKIGRVADAHIRNRRLACNRAYALRLKSTLKKEVPRF
jgi:hypothetical protein